jgi:hypothetical protein
MEIERLLEIEEQFWKGDADFYRAHVADNALMVFPEPAGVMNKEECVVATEQSPRWVTVRFENQRIVEAGTANLLIYKAFAEKANGDTYSCLASSAYFQSDGAWLLALHQQTPA